jgi:DNA-binding transcriptional LysR family regulator
MAVHLKSLKVFCDVVRQRSFSRAAEENEISQSAASQVVQQLEERLGVLLIDRSKRPFVLTPEGEVFYDGCRGVLERYSTLEDKVRTLHQEVAGSVRVASIYSVGLHHMNRYLQDFLSDLTIRREIDRVLHLHRVEVQVVMEFDNIETIKRAIEIDAGLGLLPEPTVLREVAAGTLVAVPLDTDELVRPLGIIHRRGKQLSTTTWRFIELLKSSSDRVPAEHAAAAAAHGRHPELQNVPLATTNGKATDPAHNGAAATNHSSNHSGKNGNGHERPERQTAEVSQG